MCRTADARAIGGFYPEDYPSADYYFYARFAHRFALHETRTTLMTFRVALNAAIHKETNLAAMQRNAQLQSAYAGSLLPKTFRWITPLLMARQVRTTARYWRTPMSNEEVGALLGIRLPRDRPLLLYAIRAALRGF